VPTSRSLCPPQIKSATRSATPSWTPTSSRTLTPRWPAVSRCLGPWGDAGAGGV